MSTKMCAECGAPFEVVAHGRPREVCSGACRQRRYRRTDKGRAADAKFRAEHPDYSREWERTHSEDRRAIAARYRAKKRARL